MKTYHYKAKKGPTEMVEGRLSAETHDQAIDKVNELGLTPVDIWEENSVETPREKKALAAGTGKKTGARDLLAFYRQMAKLTKSGVPVLQSVFLLAQQTESESLREVLKKVHQEVREGNSLSGALSLFPRIFTSFDIGMIQTGEAAGQLEEVLERIAAYHETEREMNSKVRSALAYPAFIIVVAIFTVSFMLTQVIPKYSRFFSDLGQELPVITKILIAASAAMQAYGGFVLIVLASGAILGMRLLKTPAVRVSWDALWLKMPVIGKVILKSEISRMARTLELLLRSGISLIKAMRILVPVVRNFALRRELETCRAQLEQGGFLSDSLKKARYFPPFVCYFVGIGEESGRLDETLREIADWYEKDTMEAIKIMMSLLEPGLILVVGIILGFIIMAVLLPVFSINTMVV